MFPRFGFLAKRTPLARFMGDKLKPLIRVAVTGAAGQIGYSLLPRIASGEVFGADQPMILQLLELDNEVAMAALRGVVMEMQDCAFPLLHGMVATSDTHEAFANIDYALMVGAKPRGPGMERADLLEENGKVFQLQGRALNEVAKRSVQAIIVGNPANTNALICSHNAPDIPASQFTALMRLDQDRAMAQVAERTGHRVHDVEHLAVWGNHSPSMYPDLTHATVAGKPALEAMQNDTKWVAEVFRPTVQKRGAQIIKARGKSSAASAANAAIAHTRDLVHGTDGKWISMAPASDGTYGIDRDIFCGLPCIAEPGFKYSRVMGLKWDEMSEELIMRSVAELRKERDLVRKFL